jgi:hypothetical protein
VIILNPWRWVISMAMASKILPWPTQHKQRLGLVRRWCRQFRCRQQLRRWQCSSIRRGGRFQTMASKISPWS